MTGVQITADNTEKLLDSMEDSANEFRLEKREINDLLANICCLSREESLQKLKKLEGRISLILHALHRKGWRIKLINKKIREIKLLKGGLSNSSPDSNNYSTSTEDIFGSKKTQSKF